MSQFYGTGLVANDEPQFYHDAISGYNQLRYWIWVKDSSTTPEVFDSGVAGLVRSFTGFADILAKTGNPQTYAGVMALPNQGNGPQTQGVLSASSIVNVVAASDVPEGLPTSIGVFSAEQAEVIRASNPTATSLFTTENVQRAQAQHPELNLQPKPTPAGIVKAGAIAEVHPLQPLGVIGGLAGATVLAAIFL